jgi:signal transduction histidine kinase
MRKRIERARRNGLRIFLITNVAVTWLVFALMVFGMMLATFKLHRQNVELQKENEHLQTTVMLELEVLSLGKEVSIRRYLPEAAFTSADKYQTQLAMDADSPQKQSLTLNIVRKYGNFRKNAIAGEREGQVDLSYQIFSELQSLRALNTQQLEETRQTALRINQLSQWWGIVLLIVAGMFLMWGSLELWLRIFNPIIALSRTARAIAGGHMNVRAPVLRNDELGALSETFNTMANAMVEREKERMHFVATIAHDLKNPLVVIGGLAHLLEHKKEAATTDEQNEWLGLIVQNTRKLEEIIAELTDATQAVTGRLQLNLQEVDLSRIVQGVIEEHAESEKKYCFQCEIREVPKIEGDIKKIERVVMNLISNAMKYSPPGTLISVQLHDNKKWVKLHITDQGVGMSYEDVKKIFIPFVRLEHTQDMAPGTGLGLLSVKKIVEAHGGRIRLHSELGKGTRVVVLFPKPGKKKKR